MAVLNKYHHGGKVPPGAVNIMRGTPFGNPFPVGGAGGLTRDEAVDQFRRWLWNRLKTEPEFATQVRALHGRDLCCCCAPKRCHGDVLANAADYLARRDATMRA